MSVQLLNDWSGQIETPSMPEMGFADDDEDDPRGSRFEMMLAVCHTFC